MSTFVALVKEMRTFKLRLGSLIAGILTALVVVISQLFYFQAPEHHSKKEVKTEQQEDDQSGDDTYITLPSSTLPSSVHIELDQQFCLLEILCEEEEDTEPSTAFTLPINTFFQNLFGAIISPNAP